MIVSWSQLKSFVDSKNLSIQWIDVDDYYLLLAFDGIFTLETRLDKFPTDNTNLTDFETNYKSLGNKKIQTQDSSMRFGYKSTTSITKTAIQATAYTEQTTNGRRSFKSTSANDITGGTGARNVKLTYYDSNVNGPFTETITLNGLTAVNTVATNICLIEKLEVFEVGSTGGNAGAINLYTGINGTGTIFVSIAIQDNMTYFAHHYIPKNKTMYLLTIAGSSKGNNYLLDGVKRELSQPVSAISYASYNSTGTLRVYNTARAMQYILINPFLIVGPAKFTLFVKADSTTAGTIHGDFTFYEV